jgi:hypothetical protein
LSIPELKVETEIVRKIDITDLENWLSEVYNIPRTYISLQADNEWGNDGIYNVYAEDHTRREGGLKEGIDLWGTKQDTYDTIQKLLRGEHVDGRDIPYSSSLIDYAASVGWLEPGEYLVEVW